MSEASPEGFMLDGDRHDWQTGRMPETEQDWITEYRLLLKRNNSSTLLWGKERDKADQLAQQVATLAEEMQLLAAEREQPAFHLGKRPETPKEIDAEVRLRETERRWEVELADRKHRADLAYEQSGLIRRAESVRGWALVAVVFAIIASPWVAMIAGVAAKDFSLYITPVTGIAGAIIGYWFGQGQQNPLQPPTIANSPIVPPLAESRSQQPGS
ncbi:hypothetical protein [Streptomyces sp. PanSC19]|uniref:hypothetical protein n=1 Tax=Streptomyces sp. PanSC19 TaxID=1520455 RepID=UPI0011CE4F39|nr:hypothetical protein [Streptomyces sp. PanSC19]